MLQRLLSAVFTKLDCSIFSVMFLLFRWREAYFNGTGRWIFKKTGVRKTTVIASIMFLTELVLFFTEIMPEHSLPSSAQTRAIPSVTRPIFVARMKGYVMTILNHMISCFRSNYRSTESGLKKYVMNKKSCCFGSDMGVEHCHTSNLCCHDVSVYQDHSESHAPLF